jgi:hypothetical protein
MAAPLNVTPILRRHLIDHPDGVRAAIESVGVDIGVSDASCTSLTSARSVLGHHGRVWPWGATAMIGVTETP